MFLRFNEVRSSGEKQHAVVVVFVPPALVVAVVVLWSERRRREQGGRKSKEEVEIFWRSRELSHLPSTFYLCLHSQHLVSLYSLRALMKPPINPLLPTYFSDLADLSHHISPIYSTSLLITSLIPLPISQLPQKQK